MTHNDVQLGRLIEAVERLTLTINTIDSRLRAAEQKLWFGIGAATVISTLVSVFATKVFHG
jgi:hypothetical protein